MTFFYEVLERGAVERGERACIVDARGERTWREVATMMRATAEQVRALGPCSKALLLLGQNAESVALLAACDLMRLDVALVSDVYGRARAVEWAGDVGADRLLAIEQGVPVQVQAPVRPASTARPAGGPHVEVLTSGSTGAPKAVRHDWGSLSASVRQRDTLVGARWCCGYPLAHFAGLQVMITALWNRGALVLPADFSPASGLEALLASRARYLSCTPTYLRRLLLTASPDDWSASALEQVTLGGEIADQALLDAMRGRRPGVRVAHVYASTEAGEILSVTDGLEGFDAARLDGVALKVVEGELFVRRSSASMVGAAAEHEAWLGTGDLVTIRAGRVRFAGRRADVINVGGFKVSPVEVEAVIRAVAGVADVCVLPHPSSITGNLVKAAIVLARPGDADRVRAEVQRRCAELLPAHMRPRIVELVESLALTPSQKASRGAPRG